MSDEAFKTKLDRLQFDVGRGTIPNPKKAWTALFDRQTPADLKAQLRSSLRAGMESYVREFVTGYDPARERPSFGIRSIAEVSRDTLAVIVMSGGYAIANYYYPRLQAYGASSNFAFIGYSSGASNHTSPKRFSDGSEMTGKVFVHEEDLSAIMASNRILLIDDYIETRVTLLAIGDALKRLGYQGPITEMDNSAIIRNWCTRLLADAPVELPSTGRPVITEKGMILKEAERK